MHKILAQIIPATVTVLLLFNFLPQINTESIKSSVLGEKAVNKTYKVGLQVGHWNNRELPEELGRLRENDGAQIEGIKEWEVNYKIAQLTAENLRGAGVEVDLLPATIPSDYKADLFLTIHADQNPTEDISGYKISPSSFSKNQSKYQLVKNIEEEYGDATKMKKDDHYTINMTNYYAFNFKKYEHAINEEVPAALIETGFLPNKEDQKIILNNPQQAADGISKGILKYLKLDKIL